MRFTVSAVAISLALTPAFAAQESLELERADGSPIHFTLDRPKGEAAGLILIAQGSGCLPGASNRALATVRAAFADHAALIVEKIGITPDADIRDGSADCPAAFVEAYTLSQRIDDYRAVLALLEQDTRLSADRLVLYGGSEGGLAVAKLAAELDPVATVLMSSGTGLPLGEMIRSTVPPEGHATIDAGFAAARAAPDSDQLFAGSSHRFWADILDERSLDYMLDSDGPFLLIQGGRDLSNPVAAARLTADDFAATGDCRLTYWEFPALDHGMLMPDGTSRLAEIAALAAEWAKAPLPAC